MRAERRPSPSPSWWRACCEPEDSSLLRRGGAMTMTSVQVLPGPGMVTGTKTLETKADALTAFTAATTSSSVRSRVIAPLA